MTKSITIICVCLLPWFSYAQPPADGGMHPDRKRIESMEVAYLTRELNLSPEDAQKFWPVFNKYREEVKAVNTQANITDPLEKQQKILDTRKKYRNDFTKVLGSERGHKVFTSEDQFRKMVKGAAQAKKRVGERRSQMQQKPQMRGRNMPLRRF